MRINEWISYGKTDDKGLGVFASQYIKKNTPLICDIVRTITKDEQVNLRDSEIYHHFFVDRSQYDVDPGGCDLHIAFGPISIVNHTNAPNCELKWTLGGIFSNVELISSKDIFPGEELSIYYMNVKEYDFYERNSI